MTEAATSYLLPVQAELARFLSMQDREAPSLTYGCFDRTYWAWKFTDFAGARFQEGVYSLAHLFSTTFNGNLLAGQPRVLDWIRAGLRFWQHLQYRDGSFDEAYPFEHSLAATAFTGFYVGEAFLRVTEWLPVADQSALRQSLARAGSWLCRNDERHGVLSNHLAAAAAALYVIFRITGEDRFEQRSRHFVQRIYDHQSAEGWFEEYGGADPGYQTHCTFYLARLWQYTEDKDLLDSLRRSLSFLKHFVHPNGTLGGEYGSRNTEFYFPAGFEMLAGHLADAAQIAGFMRSVVAAQRVAGLAAMDPYNFFPLLNNYLFAAESATELSPGPLPCELEGEWSFPDAGLLVKSTPAYYAVLGMSKGGVVKLYERATRRLAVSDCGYWARLNNGKLISNQRLNRAAKWSLKGEDVCGEIDFAELKQRVLSSWLFMGFRFFSLTFGRLQAAAYWLKDNLVRALVRDQRTAPLRLKRCVRFGANYINIRDELELCGNLPVERLQRDAKFATIHMGSSRYFQSQELQAGSHDDSGLAQKLMQERRLSIDWRWENESR
jgi:hypothetical protein